MTSKHRTHFAALAYLGVSLFLCTENIKASEINRFDPTLLGELSWNSAVGENFWIYDYWYPACNSAFPCSAPNGQIGVTHTGRDYHPPSQGSERPVRLPGFGKVTSFVLGSVNPSSLSYLTSQHLLASGESVFMSLLHSNMGDHTILLGKNPSPVDSYVTTGQYIGREGHRGLLGGDHVHLEFSEGAQPEWICTNTTYPDSAGGRIPDPKLSKDNLSAHYGDGACVHHRTSDRTRNYFSPKGVLETKQLMPFIGNGKVASQTNFDVYGSVGQEINVFLRLNRSSPKTFKAIGVRASSEGDRRNPKPIPLLDKYGAWNNKWLARTWTGNVDWKSASPVWISGQFDIGGKAIYSKPQTLQLQSFVSTSESDFSLGYPVRIDILESRLSKIIDNDKPSETDIEGRVKEIFSLDPGKSGNISLYPRNTTVPGYFLSSELYRGQRNVTARWIPGVLGKYRMYAHVPDNALSRSKVVYKIYPKGMIIGSPPLLACIKQQLTTSAGRQSGAWVPLIVSAAIDLNLDGIVDINDLQCYGDSDNVLPTSVEFGDANNDGSGDGYLGLELANRTNLNRQSPEKNIHVPETEFVAIDAIKFEYVPLDLNDTGVSRCIIDKGILWPIYEWSDDCTQSGQDAAFGRDVSLADPIDGHLGFSFQKLDSNGKPLPADALAWSCVKDNLTGLMWEIKTSDGSTRDYTRSFTDLGNLQTNDVSTYIKSINDEKLCGYKDWRLPSVSELLSIRDFGVEARLSSIDLLYFPYTSPYFYRSSQPVFGYADTYRWGVDFGGYFAATASLERGLAFYVRLVRDAK